MGNTNTTATLKVQGQKERTVSSTAVTQEQIESRNEMSNRSSLQFRWSQENESWVKQQSSAHADKILGMVRR